MLKENDKLTEALIQIIQSLPETNRKAIAENLTEKKSKRSKFLGKKRKLGALKGKVSIPADFNEPLNELKEYM